MTTKVRSIRGVNSRSIFGLQLFHLNLGSTPLLAPVPSMSHLRLCGGGKLWIQIQPQIHIWVVTFYLNLGFTPFLAPVPSMSHLSSCGGHLWIQIHFWVVLFELNLGSIPSLATVPSHCSGVRGQLFIQIKL